MELKQNTLQNGNGFVTKAYKGRAAGFNTVNRFEGHHFEPLDIEAPYEENAPQLRTSFYLDSSRSILARNNSPDLPFSYSINPYRGCEHGCIYCYARPSHEYLGFSAGLDFESKIMVKMDAPRLLRETLRKESWEPQMVAFSGNTDCYQPIERKLRLTRQCLEVFLEYGNPVGIITKNAMIERDIDVLQQMSEMNIAAILMSITTLNRDLAGRMEPRTSSPAARLRVIEQLAKAGIVVGVNVAPVIPGLTDEEIPSILKAASEAGATRAGYILVRLPGPVEPLFLDWLKREVPDRAGRILNRITETRQGGLSDSRFGSRMTGQGEIAAAIHQLFDLNIKKYGYKKRWEGLTTVHFTRPGKPQMELFS